MAHKGPVTYHHEVNTYGCSVQQIEAIEKLSLRSYNVKKLFYLAEHIRFSKKIKF